MDGLSFAEFAKKVYQQAGIAYPKFFKMDNLSKLAFLPAELILREAIDHSKENDIALVFANRSSSLDTDVLFQNTINDKDNFFPSPSVFVYTLPSICMGEISIRHQLKSEHSFFIFAEFNALFIKSYSDVLLSANKADKVLCGWVEYFNEEYKAFLYLVSKEARSGAVKNDTQTIEKLFYK